MYFSKLNVPQRQAIRYLDGPLLVIAGAGSGKMRVITEKMTYLIEEMGISAAHIAAITCTNKAAKEMLSRMKNRLSSSAIRGLTVSTFHSLGLKILRLEAQHLGYKPNFSILDASDAAGILSDIMETTSKDEVRKVSGLISALKNDAEAVTWYTKAAEQGHFSASYKLGQMYNNGEGVQKDETEAVKWLKKVAEQGHVGAQEIIDEIAKQSKKPTAITYNVTNVNSLRPTFYRDFHV